MLDKSRKGQTVVVITEIEGCEYTVNGEPYKLLDNAVHAWMDKGTGHSSLQAWRDDKLIARHGGPFLGWLFFPFPLSKGEPPPVDHGVAE